MLRVEAVDVVSLLPVPRFTVPDSRVVLLPALPRLVAPSPSVSCPEEARLPVGVASAAAALRVAGFKGVLLRAEGVWSVAGFRVSNSFAFAE